MLCFAGFELDPERARLRGPGGEAIRLRPKSFDMLQLFVTNAGRVLSKQDLIDAIWPNVHVGDDSLFQCVREIRAALGDDQRQLIKLVSGRGYLFDGQVTVGPGGLGAADQAPPPVAMADADPVAAASPKLAAEPVRKRLRFGLRAALATAAGLGAVIGLAVGAPIFVPDFIFARKPPTVAAEQLVGVGEGQKLAELAASVADRLSAAVSLAAAAPVLTPDSMFPRKSPTIAMMPIVGVGDSQLVAEMAGDVTDRLTDGLARIDKLRVLAPRSQTASAVPQPVAAQPEADFVVSGELRLEGGAWTIQARMSNGATGEVRWSNSVSVGIEKSDMTLQQIRLAAGVGHPLALRINAMINAGPAATDDELAGGAAKVVIEQAMASINQTTPERFKAAQTMLEKAIAADPGNVDLAAALAAHLLRGIQMTWYNKADVAETQRAAQSMLEQALRAKPTYIPVLEAYCRLLNTTNQFIESLVACGRVLTFDPWDGLAIYNLGLGQLRLGRFEDALATFKLAEQFDTPRTARWTWLLGAGLTLVVMERDEEAIPYLTKSIAITPATGRSHAVLAIAYQRTGRTDEAKAALAKTMELRPGSTVANIRLDPRNASPVYNEAAKRVEDTLLALGMAAK
ncbi:winged helix-turn-helix domain-containing tetratricopeptide repeat protein [Bradyrhizobium sp. AUGA SZCCT0182]|uniref:winged helix-turn-helix domain-containing tetratricopeptide repeat protein n=1 Tax=Bradyrhizobium sp. AUGA SZCCT0182 TaxID=2807667 RepID=UPI001BAC2FAE|nr:winged helix-turn-helix domain-containing protein [Bradyrhizobium sp. AUGA SZCCT0182]MBR1234980.1 winged helix-turn-helix domain-containing protein [Bradyrhizobium sp. AUGA SZCCT0182]